MSIWRAIITILIFLVCNEQAIGQEENIDKRNKDTWAIAIANPDSAISLSEAIISDADRIGYVKGKAQAMSQLGAALDIRGDSEKGLTQLLSALTLQKEMIDQEGMAFTYSNLGFLYYVRNDYAEAASNFEHCLALEEQFAKPGDIAGTKINLGLMLSHLGKSALSEQYFHKALQGYQTAKDTLGIITARYNLSTQLLKQERYGEALTIYEDNELDMIRLGADSERLSSLYYSMTKAYLGLGQMKSALNYAKKNLAICEPEGMIQRRQYAFESLEEVYRKMGEFKIAHRYLSSYSQLRDSLYMIEQADKLRSMETEYKLKEAKRETEQAEWKAEAAISEGKSYRLLSFALIGLLASIGLVIWLYRSNRRKNNQLLNERVSSIEKRLADKEILMGEVHHRVKNNLQLVHSMIEMQSQSTPSLVAAEALTGASSRIAAIAKLHHFLYASDDTQKVDIAEYLNSLLDALVSSSSKENQIIEIQSNLEHILIDVESAIPIGLICNELVTNAIKHGLPEVNKPKIEISLKEKDDKLHLIIKDNGPGQLDMNEVKSGYGTRIVRVLCEQLRATWQTKTSDGYEHQLEINQYK